MDGAGNVIIADYGNRRVRKIATSGIITTIVGTGASGSSGDGGPATAALLNGPGALALDGSGNLYIADVYGDKIRKVNTSGTISTIVGTGAHGFSGDGGAATAAMLNHPSGLAFDGSGNLYICDNGNFRIRKVTPSGTITTVAGNGTYAYGGDGGAATAAQLEAPWGIAVDASGVIYVTEDKRVRKISTSGIITTFAGTGTLGWTGDGGPATAARVTEPSDVKVDAAGNVFIADLNNNCIRKVSSAGIITTIAGTGTAGYNGDGAATATQFHAPQYIALSGAKIYLSDATNSLARVYEPATTSVGNAANTTLPVISVAPCPSKGTFTLNVQSITAEEIQLIITDATGKKVDELTTTANKATEVQLHVPAGIYYISTDTRSGRAVEKIVVE
jgi:hypothetical protein